MRNFLLLLSCFLVFSSFSTLDHETYLSVTEIEYREDRKTVQVVSRVFIDDMENALSMRYGKKVTLATKEDLLENKNLLAKYYAQKLHLKVKDQPVSLKLLGSKFDADQIVLFLEGKEVHDFKKVQVENLVLTDMFDSQKNIVHVIKGEAIESMLLVKDRGQNTVNF